jgi:hypothetical protein
LGIRGHRGRIEVNYDGVYIIHDLDIWEGFFRVMMANGSLLLMATRLDALLAYVLDDVPGGLVRLGYP